MVDIDGIGGSFIKHYYETFDSNRGAIGNLYVNESQLTWEGAKFQGRDAIVKKIVDLNFKVVKHVITTADCQAIMNGSIVVFVVGQLQTDDDPPHGFSQTFVLSQLGDSLYVVNEMFRLQLHHQ